MEVLGLALRLVEENLTVGALASGVDTVVMDVVSWRSSCPKPAAALFELLLACCEYTLRGMSGLGLVE